MKAGRITEAEIDRSLERLFVARVRLGMFDPPERVPYSKIAISENDSSAHRVVARDAEREAIVLLKNEGGVLPLRRSVRRIAVLGPSAADPVALLGNYNGISSRQVTPLEGIERQFPGAEVRYALGATYTAATPALVPSTFLAPPEGKGPACSSSTSTIRTSRESPSSAGASRGLLRHGDGGPRRGRGRRHEKYSVRWTATLTPPASGEYELTVRTGMWNWTATARLFLDDKELTVGGGPSTQVTSTQASPGPRRPVRVRVALEAGRKYALRVEYRQTGAGGTIQLAWMPPADATLSEAVALARAPTSPSSSSD